MPRREKFSEKALQASSSRNRICDGVGSEEEDALEWKGFRDGADLHLGAIDMTNVNGKETEREKKRETIRKVPTHFKYNKHIEKRVHMHEKCINMCHVI